MTITAPKLHSKLNVVSNVKYMNSTLGEIIVPGTCSILTKLVLTQDRICYRDKTQRSEENKYSFQIRQCFVYFYTFFRFKLGKFIPYWNLDIQSQKTHLKCQVSKVVRRIWPPSWEGRIFEGRFNMRLSICWKNKGSYKIDLILNRYVILKIYSWSRMLVGQNKDVWVIA